MVCYCVSVRTMAKYLKVLHSCNTLWKPKPKAALTLLRSSFCCHTGSPAGAGGPIAFWGF